MRGLRNSINKKLSIILPVLLALCLVSCSKKDKNVNEVSVRLKWVFTSHTAAGPGVALNKGFFKEEGIDVTLNPGGFEFDPVTLVASGSDDFGIKGADDVLIARSKGVPIVAIAMDYQTNPVCFMSLKDSGIVKPQDFVGKKVAVKYGQNVYTFYKAMLRKLRIDERQVTEIPVKFDITPLLTHSVDVLPGYATYEPALFKEKGIEINVILAKDHGVPACGNVVFTSEKIIKENPDLVERFLRAYIKGWKYAVEHPEEAADIMAKLNPRFARDVQLDMMKLTIPYIKPTDDIKIGWMTIEGWKETQEVMLEEKILEKPVDLDKAFTLDFLERIYK